MAPGSKPLALVERDGALWFSQAGASRIGRIDPKGAISSFPIPSPNAQPRAIALHPAGGVWFVETNSNALGRVDAQGKIEEFLVGIDNASLRGVTAGADGDLWFTANFANQIGHMKPDGEMVAVYDCPTPASGPRCIMSHSSGRLFYGAFDAAMIGEVRFV